MLKSVLTFVCVSACLALEAEPAQTSFMPFALGGLDLGVQQALFRRMSDIFLGMQVSSSFHRFGELEYQKFQFIEKSSKDVGVVGADNEESLEEEDEQEQLVHLQRDEDHIAELKHAKLEESDSDAEIARLEEEKDEEEDNQAKLEEEDEYNDDELAMLELKEDVTPMPFGVGAQPFVQPFLGAYGAFPGMMGAGTPYGPAPTTGGVPSTRAEFEEQGAHAKFTALKALQIQFHFASGDVQKAYWANKAIIAVLPPQFGIFKLYKQYLNTIAMSTAYQFYDAFNLESILDDFNDRWGIVTGAATHLSEAKAELTVYTQWHSLATVKYQLFMINMYEKMMAGQMFAQMVASVNNNNNNNNNNQASSYLEVEEQAAPAQSQFMPGMFGGPQMNMYLQYYTMWLKYSSITTEMQLSQVGFSVASAKVSKQENTQTHDLRSKYLPMLYMQWGSTNQMRYYLEYYSLMTEVFMPQLATMQAIDRAENVFQNLAQTEAQPTKAN